MVILYLTNYLIKCLGEFVWKNLGSFVTPGGAIQILSVMEHKQKFRC